MARLRQAKEEAEREIAEHRAQVECEFQRKLAEVSHVLLNPIHVKLGIFIWIHLVL